VTADPSPRWGIVADDLTGAADSAVGFADAGWPVLVLLGDVPPGETESGLRSVLATRRRGGERRGPWRNCDGWARPDSS
jgi:hypothetical protein